MQRLEDAQKLAEERAQAAFEAKQAAEQACIGAHSLQQVCDSYSMSVPVLQHALLYIQSILHVAMGRGFLCLTCYMMTCRKRK